MAVQQSHRNLEALRKLEASLKAHLCKQDARMPDGDEDHRACAPRLISLIASTAHLGSRVRDMRLRLWWPRLRKFVFAGGALGGLVMLALVALWWRLSNGPIELDIATPWLTAAIEENFGSGHEVEIGGTQLERDASGRTSLRIRDIVVRDAEGTVVASAPKAEVGISGSGLFAGRIRAERLSLVGAEMAVRIESDSKVTVFAGGNKRPFVTASAASAPLAAQALRAAARVEQAAAGAAVAPASAPAAAALPVGNGVPDFAALLAWIESLDAAGLDGRDLTEIGLKGGNLTVDDQRNGKQWTFTNIDLSVTRPKDGGIAITLGSESVERPWQMRAAMTPGPQGHRVIDVETQKVSAKDVLLAMRLGEGLYEPDLAAVGAHPCRYRTRRHAAYARRPDPGGEGGDRRSRRSAGTNSDRSRRNQPGLGCHAPSAGDAVPGAVRRQSHHPARAIRRAARRQQCLGAASFRWHRHAGLGGAGRS